MVNKTFIMCVTVVTILFFFSGPVSAADPISTINSGNTVFIGEQGLDIQPAMGGDTILGWWASGAAISTSSPDYTINVPNTGSFSVNPSDFASHTGAWYHLSPSLKSNGAAFNVADPYINLKIEDTTVGVDVTDKWVPTDDELQFRIESNLAQIMQRTSVTYVPVTIKVRDPNGGLLSSLTSKSGTTTTLVDYHLTSNPQSTGAIWGTSNRGTYPPGSYSVWVECNVNSMKDNYGQTGKTISSSASLLNQDRNPLIGDKSYVTNPSTPVTTAYTKTPTTAKTTMATPVTTILTMSPSPSITSTILETTIPSTTIPESTTIPTKSPGFEAGFAIAAMIFGVVLCLKKK
jgi:hypothetical protein